MKNSLQITWLGHAAFLLEPPGGARLLLDPYCAPDAGAYAPIHIPADIVLASHLNPKYHSHWEAGGVNAARLNGLDIARVPGGMDTHGIHFSAVQVWESAERTVPVSMPYFSRGGVSVCHSGDLGHALSPDQAAPVRGIDVFLAVAGGPPTISLPDLKNAISLIQPRLVIPMHYQNGKINLPIQPLEDFLALFDRAQIDYYSEATLMVSPDTLPAQTRIAVLPSAL